MNPDSFFDLKRRGTTAWREVLGGAVTFLTMAYIIFTQPLMMKEHSEGWATFDFATGTANDVFLSLMVGTCIIAALACFVMAFLANLPVALAPGMGINVMFASMIGMAHIEPDEALGVILISGILFFIFSFFKLREFIMSLIRPSQQAAIVVGIGVFILILGLLMSASSPGKYSLLKASFEYNFSAVHLTVFLINLAIVGALVYFRVPAGLFIGIIAGAVVAGFAGILSLGGIVGPVPPVTPTLFHVDILGALKIGLIPFIAIFLYVDMFETMATLIGVTRKAGLVDDEGNIPRASRALKADAIGTLGGSLLGISPVTSYIESSAGVVSGARTGLASVVTGLLFVIAIFFTPLWLTLASNVIVGPVLVIVGLYMLSELQSINWGDWSDYVPAIATIVVMAAMFSISDGLAAGFIAYPVCKLFAGKGKEVNWLAWLMAAISVVMLIVIHVTY